MKICIITLLLSLAGPGGGFDVPKSKCPPDRGSSDCVTGSPASYSSNSSFSDNSSLFSQDSSYFPKSILYPPTPPLAPSDLPNSLPIAAPRAIPGRPTAARDLSTPPLTPDEGDDGIVHTKHSNDALDFLLTLFPRDGLTALPFAKSVSISAPNMGADFDGVVLELPGQPKTLYVDGKSAPSVCLRESIVALLDLADESLECSALVIALERSSPSLGALLHSLMYVGGTVVTEPAFQVDPTFVLVGLEI
jgi:hypothetical protein